MILFIAIAELFPVLADLTNGRACAVLCVSVVCNVCIVAKRCVLPKKIFEEAIGKWTMGNQTPINNDR